MTNPLRTSAWEARASFEAGMLLLQVVQPASDICGDRIISTVIGGWHRPARPRPVVVNFNNTLS